MKTFLMKYSNQAVRYLFCSSWAPAEAMRDGQNACHNQRHDIGVKWV